MEPQGLCSRSLAESISLLIIATLRGLRATRDRAARFRLIQHLTE